MQLRYLMCGFSTSNVTRQGPNRINALLKPVWLHMKSVICDLVPDPINSRCWWSCVRAQEMQPKVFVEGDRGKQLTGVMFDGPFGWAIVELKGVSASTVTYKMDMLVIRLAIVFWEINWIDRMQVIRLSMYQSTTLESSCRGLCVEQKVGMFIKHYQIILSKISHGTIILVNCFLDILR